MSTVERMLIKCFLRCELCAKHFRNYQWNYRNGALKHRRKCLRENIEDYNNIPDSTLYKCNKCLKNLKVWPADKLQNIQCTYCKKIVINNGTNVHVCFRCAGSFILQDPFKFHICSDHQQTRHVVEITWEPESVDFGLSVTNNHSNTDPPDIDTEDIALPTYEEAMEFPNVSLSTSSEDSRRHSQQLRSDYSPKQTNKFLKKNP